MQLSNRVRAISQETSCEKHFVDETPGQQAQHREIAQRYSRKRGRRRPSLVPLRIRDLEAFYREKYGAIMPNDDPRALDCLIVLLHHVAGLGDPRAVRACAARWAPWLTEAEYAAIVVEIECTPLRWGADSLAREIGLDDAVRTLLRITTIGANDCDKAQRSKRRKRRNTAAHRARRAEAGAGSHATSAEHLKPWRALGMSRRTYYRKLAIGTLGTDSSAAAFLSMRGTNQCQTGGPPRERGSEARAVQIGEKNCTADDDRGLPVVNISDAEPLNLVPRAAFERASPRYVSGVRIGKKARQLTDTRWGRGKTLALAF
jgi:hypothetical protein